MRMVKTLDRASCSRLKGHVISISAKKREGLVNANAVEKDMLEDRGRSQDGLQQDPWAWP